MFEASTGFESTGVERPLQGETWSSLDADQTLSLVRSNRARREALERDEIEGAAHWACLHSFLDMAGTIALPGAERLVMLGGEGTPEVAEFAPAEFGAELGISPSSAAAMIGDALDLLHRLPVLWGRIRSGDVKPFVGRKIAQATRDLSLDAVAAVDLTVSRWADRLPWGRLASVVEAAVIRADPAAAVAAAEAIRSTQGVWVSETSERGTKNVFIRADASDVTWFDGSLDRIADGLAILGDASTKDVRRARALGVLAHPQQALDLYDEVVTAMVGSGSAKLPPDVTSDAGLAEADAYGADDGPSTRDSARAVSVDADNSPVAAPSRRRRNESRPKATLFVHLTQDSLSEGGDGRAGVARVEGVGSVTIDQARRWLGHCDVTIKPVIDLADIAPVDSYEIPDRLREAVHLLSPADCFPGGSSTRRTGDIDHTTPYVPMDRGGPPAQTRIGGLGRLPRFHHRIRTHGRWQVKQPFPGIFIWRTPHGRFYLVDHTGTRRIPSSA